MVSWSEAVAGKPAKTEWRKAQPAHVVMGDIAEAFDSTSVALVTEALEWKQVHPLIIAAAV